MADDNHHVERASGWSIIVEMQRRGVVRIAATIVGATVLGGLVIATNALAFNHPRVTVTSFDVLVWSWALLQVPCCVWLFRAQPPAAIWRQYPFSTRLHAVIPGTAWRSRIRPEHLPQFEKYRVRAFVQWTVTVGTFTILYFYLFFT